MTHLTSRHIAFFAATAFVLAAGAFLPTAPAAAATTGTHTTYCLTSDSENDCGFASLAQCEATASGGLGECSMVPAWSRPQDATALDHFRVRSGEMSRR
jgi:uncharacterized protein DUF3551